MTGDEERQLFGNLLNRHKERRLARRGTVVPRKAVATPAVTDRKPRAPRAPQQPARSGQLGNLVLRYVAERADRGELRPTSALTYRENLCLFAESIGVNRAPNKVTRRHIELFLARRSSRATKRGRLSMIKNFLGWCILNGYARKNPALGVHSISVPQAVPRALPAAQVAAALDAARDSRERVAISLIVQEMLRAQEVAGLELGDIDLDEKLLVVRKGKGGGQRVLQISDETVEAVRRYLGEHPAHSGWFIRSYPDPSKPIQPKYLAALVGRAMHRAGVKDTGHSLRHTGASDMLDGGANIRQVQIALGHANLGTTQRYLRWSGGRSLRDAMGGRSYRVDKLTAPAAGAQGRALAGPPPCPVSGGSSQMR